MIVRPGHRFVAAAALAAAAAAAGAQPTAASAAAQPTAGAEAVEAGRKLYVSACQRCHGINLVTSGIGFDLRTFQQSEKERFVRSVTNGVRAMPAWGGTLKPEQLDLLWIYIGAVNGWKATPAQQ